MKIYYCTKQGKCYAPGTTLRNCSIDINTPCGNVKSIELDTIIKEIENRISMMSTEEILQLSKSLTNRQYLKPE